MIFESLQVTGSFQVTGSVHIPVGPSASRTTQTGSLFFDTDNISLEGNTGTEWISGSSTEEAPAPPPTPLTIDYLVLAGGGGGGGRRGSGGGAGGYRTSHGTGSISGGLTAVEDSLTVTSGSTYTVTVGAGGAAAANQSSAASGDGSDSVFSTITSLGGGGGVPTTHGIAASGELDGGSGAGGGAGENWNIANSGNANGQVSNAPPGDGTTGQGFGGGVGSRSGNGGYGGGGGGGGAGATGASTTVHSAYSGPAAGGAGLASTITETSVTRGAGGAAINGLSGATGTAASANTGGGGGGGSEQGQQGGNGGSGVIIIAYPSSSLDAEGGTKTTRADGYNVHTFTTSGTLTVGGPGDFDPPSGPDLLGDGSAIAHFPLDGDAGNDVVGSSITATFTGTSAVTPSFSSAQTRFGSTSLTFTGTANSPNPGGYSTNVGAYSGLSFWFYLTANHQDDILIFCLDIQREGSSNSSVFDTSGNYSTGQQSQTGAWHHYAVSDNGSNITTYYDGTLVNTRSRTSTFQHTALFSSSNSNDSFRTYLSNVRLFNRALTQADVTILYNET